MQRANGVRFKTDDVVLNLCLLSLLLDFGLSEQLLASLICLSVPWHGDGLADKRQLQVEVSNWLHEFDKRNHADSSDSP